jgi:hypothetical protein
VNKTVHGILHLSRVPIDADRFHAFVAVYVQRKGVLGTVYMALIKPFRHLAVYPILLKELTRGWEQDAPEPALR